MDYKLNNTINKDENYTKRLIESGKELGSYLNKRSFAIATGLAIISSATSVVTPYLLGYSIDTYIATGNISGLGMLILLLLGIYVANGFISYFEQIIMGKASQAALYKLRGVIFEKIQSLPIAFFNQNRTGDLMSRVNNDTDKLSQFLSESILRFVGSAFTLVGIGAFVLYLNFKLGLVLLSSTIFLFVLTRIVSPKLERANKESSGALGTLTAGVSEQLTNFKVIIAFDRRNYFEEYLKGLNKDTYSRSRLSSFLNQIFSPVYDFAGYLAQAVVLVYGINLIAQGEITVGLLIGFIAYAQRFYDPLRWVANIFGNIQVSLASWGRIRDILSLSSDIVTVPDAGSMEKKEGVLVFEGVGFGYEASQYVLRNVSFVLERGKTYALVGPTGGGKSTMANLMSRLYDPTEGSIYWKGKDMKSYDREMLSSSISVILQEPYLFTGTVADNIRYGNPSLREISDTDLIKLLDNMEMSALLKRLPEGMETSVETGGENISIGQKQLISFVRTVLRRPELVILDEATANIDTVTESMLQGLIKSLPEDTTKVIIAHRLNTIKEADEILFVAGGSVKRVSDEKEVLELLKSVAKR